MTPPDLEALKTLVAICEEVQDGLDIPGDWALNEDERFVLASNVTTLERLLASQGKPEAEAVPGSSVCPICGKDSPHYHKPEEATMYNAKFVGVGPQFVQDALQHVYAAMDAMRRKGARENYDRGYNAGFNVSADILEAALKQIKSKLGWIAERTGEFPPIVFDAESAANRPLPSDKLRGLAKAASTRIHDAGCWSEDFIYQVLSEALLSQEPSSGAPVTADVEPAPPVQEAGREELQEAAAEVYQCVGTLLSDAGRFDSNEGLMLLDLLSWMSGNRDKRPDTDKLLPFASAEPASPVQEAGRETLEHVHITDKQAIVTGDPADLPDSVADDDPRRHNCDAMGCPTLDHVLYRLPFTDHRKPVDTKALAKELAESIDFTAGPVQAREVFNKKLGAMLNDSRSSPK